MCFAAAAFQEKSRIRGGLAVVLVMLGDRGGVER